MSVRDHNDPPRRILVICKGNIARSALAEAILCKGILHRPSLKDAVVHSAGTENYNVGRGADPKAIQIGREHGYDLSGHVAKQVTATDIAWADLVIVMDRANLDRLRELFDQELTGDKVRLLMSFAAKESLDIPDPYKRDYAQFQAAFRLIQLGCESLLAAIA